MTENTPTKSTSPMDANRYDNPARPRMRTSLVLSFFGLFIFIIGAKPNWLGWDRSPVVGFVQIAVFLVGLAIICIGGYLGLDTLWRGQQRSIAADIGSRLVGTGYVVAVFAGMADVFGMGSQPLPQVPYFGPWQSSGVLIGQAVIAVGFVLLIPFHMNATKEST